MAMKREKNAITVIDPETGKEIKKIDRVTPETEEEAKELEERDDVIDGGEDWLRPPYD
jgi:hypothetical protein